MNRSLEILGRGIQYDLGELICRWFDTLDKCGRIPNREVMEIIGLLENSRLETAAKKLGTYLFENPKCNYGLLAGAVLSLSENRVEQAIESLRRVYRSQPNNTMALYSLGCCYERIGQESKAIEFYQDCLKFKSYLELPRQRLGAIYFKRGQLDRAINEYEQLSGEYPEDILTQVLLGYLLIENGRYGDACQRFNKAILSYPDNFASGENNSSEHHSDVNEGGLGWVDEQLLDNPGQISLLIKRAEILYECGDFEKAIFQYEKIAESHPNLLEVAIKLGVIYMREKRYLEAAKWFTRGVEINDSIVDAYVGLAAAYKLNGSDENCLDTLSLASAIQPNSSVLFSKATELHFRGTIEQENSYTEQEYDKVLELILESYREQTEMDPGDPGIRYRRGILLMGVNRPTEAIKCFEQVLMISPEHSRAKSKLAISLLGEGKKDEAMRVFLDYEKLDGRMIELHYKVSILYCDKLRFASSLLNLEGYMEKNFSGGSTTANISIILQNLGLLDRVSVMWDNLLETTNGILNHRVL